jgi:hypothetical protein
MTDLNLTLNEIIANRNCPASAGSSSAKAGCKGFSTWTDCGEEHDCGYDTTIPCDECKYGSFGGRKDPAAKCNQNENV